MGEVHVEIVVANPRTGARSVFSERPVNRAAFLSREKQNAIIPTYMRRVEKVGGKLQNTVIDAVHDVDQFWFPTKR